MVKYGNLTRDVEAVEADHFWLGGSGSELFNFAGSESERFNFAGSGSTF